MSLPDLVRSERFALPLVTPAEVAATRAGRRDPRWHEDYPRPDDLDAFAIVRDGDPWGPRHVVRAFDGLVVGSVGFFGPPQPADDEIPETEIGYGLVPYARGRGVATEVVRALLAETDRVGVRVRASTEPENRASLRVLARCGFTQLRGSDEDGLLVLARPVPSASGSSDRAP